MFCGSIEWQQVFLCVFEKVSHDPPHPVQRASKLPSYFTGLSVSLPQFLLFFFFSESFCFPPDFDASDWWRWKLRKRPRKTFMFERDTKATTRNSIVDWTILRKGKTKKKTPYPSCNTVYRRQSCVAQRWCCCRACCCCSSAFGDPTLALRPNSSRPSERCGLCSTTKTPSWPN